MDVSSATSYISNIMTNHHIEDGESVFISQTIAGYRLFLSSLHNQKQTKLDSSILSVMFPSSRYTRARLQQNYALLSSIIRRNMSFLKDFNVFSSIFAKT